MTPTSRIWIPLLCLWLAVSGQTTAQAPGEDPGRLNGELSLANSATMPSWVVPVLRLVSSTHVEPTTGIVLSESGLVLVPENFASIGDEIIVLDGGTDIIRNGRPARIERKFPAAGMKVLSVEGLRRNGAVLATAGAVDGSRVFLSAFPPAEQITEGEPPLHAAASVVVLSETGKPSISIETPLPNVTGALLDACGNLVGVSFADDVQSMEFSSSTRYQWRESLLRLFSQMQLSPAEADCGSPSEESDAESEPAPTESVEPEEPEVPAKKTEEEADDRQAAADPEPKEAGEAEPEVPASDPMETPVDILPPIEKDSVSLSPAEEETGGRGWLWLVAAVVLIGLGLVLHRLRRGDPEPPPTTDAIAPAPLPVESDAEEDPAWDATSLDSVLRIHGELTDGTTFEDSCAVSENAVNVVIGRGEADLRIDSAAVSRQHAAVNGSGSELTVTDLGSSNGTSINGIPCLEGEVMYVEPGDTLVLGDALCMLELGPGPGERTSET